MRKNSANASVLDRDQNTQMKQQKEESNNRYNFLHDTVITSLNKNMKLYTDGKFEEYINDWRTSNDVSNARRSRFMNKNRFRNFNTDRFENIRLFMFEIMDHIRQSIVLLQQYENISLLRDEYEKILSNPYLLMRYYQYRFKKVLQKKDLNEHAQLNVVPILKPYIIEYIKTYDTDSNTGAKAIRSITNINAITTFDNVLSYIEHENNISY